MRTATSSRKPSNWDSRRFSRNPSVSRNVCLSLTRCLRSMIGEVKTHVFEVCFTTKPLGTDLAMATCRTNVQPSGEHIDVSQTGPLLCGTKVLHGVEDVL